MTCEKCNGEGFWFDETGNMIVCTCRQKSMMESIKESCGITTRMARQTLESFDLSFYTGNNKIAAQKALQDAKEFIDSFIKGEKPEGMLFLGQVGSGKTYIASAIANEILDYYGLECEMEKVKFIVIPDLLDDIRRTYKDDTSLREEEVMSVVKSVPILIFDDLGTDNSSEFAIRVIFSVLNYRLNHELPTIVTTNLSYKQIEEVYGSRICSRLTEMCRFYPLESDKDIRLAKKQKARENNARKK